MRDFCRGLLFGTLVGAVVGLMIAPQSGPQTQNALREHLRSAVEEGQRAARERRAELEARFAEARQVPLRS
jgi:gas vesicle protein